MGLFPDAELEKKYEQSLTCHQNSTSTLQGHSDSEKKNEELNFHWFITSVLNIFVMYFCLTPVLSECIVEGM